MYSFYILCEAGSEKDDIGQSGLAHVLEHFIILALIHDFFIEDSNLRGQTSYCYSLYSWSNGNYQAGLNLICEFENYVRKILKKKNEYFDLMLVAIREVEKEILSKHNEMIKYNEMIHILNKNIFSLPIGSLNDVKALKVEHLFETLDSIYIKGNLRYFIFNHAKKEFVPVDMPQKIKQKAWKRRPESPDKKLEQATTNINLDIQVFRIFRNGLKKIALPRACISKMLNKEQEILNELYLLNICKLLDKIYGIRDNCKFETIFFSNADVIIRYDIFELTSHDDIYGIANKITVDEEAIVNLLLDTTNFQDIKEELRSIVYNNRYRPITRSECETEILNIVYFNNWQVIKNYKEFVDLLQDITIDKFKRFLHFEIANIDNLIIFE